MSPRHLRGSCAIDHPSCLVNPVQEIGVTDGPRHDQVDFPMKKVFQIVKQTKEGPSMLALRQGQIFNQKIQVAPGWVKVLLSRGTKKLQGLDPVLAAQLLQLSPMLFDAMIHNCILPAPPLGRQRGPPPSGKW